MIPANNPSLKSWVDVPEGSDFPIQNLPFGVFRTSYSDARIGVRIGDHVLDLSAVHNLGFFSELPFEGNDFSSNFLNNLMKKGKNNTTKLRNRISELLDKANSEMQDKADQVLISANDVIMMMPVQIGDYTDFYSSREHATNVGMMFRDPANALLPNWLWIPVGYHGRASSVILSGQDIHRPKGQIKPDPSADPIFGPSRQVDFELEMAFVTFEGKGLGESILTSEAEEFIFGLCLFNDWSARDIQAWEYVPLGPFLAKNFASSISPWIVTLDALQPYAVESVKQNPEVLSYLKFDGNKSYDIHLEVALQPENSSETTICKSNFKYMYWNMSQQLAHHTVNGCNIRCGDLMGSGTISGSSADSYGSMLELAWKGTKPITLEDGSERKFVQDNDTVIMRGYCEANSIRIGFGEVSAKILPAK
ncbi:MAG: fumarylacetoacetase [Bacteroidota bacterium]